MGKSRSEQLQDYHNKGQEDGAHDTYTPQHQEAIGTLQQIFHTERDREDRAAYDAGHRNATNQKK